MDIPLTGNNLVIGAIAVGLLGILECFFGYRVFRIVLMILGFLIGAGLAVTFLHSDQTIVMILIAVVGGLIGAFIFSFLYFVGTFVAGLLFGAAVGIVLAQTVHLSPTATTIAIVIGAVLGGLLGFILAKYVIMLSTAFTGAAQIVYAVLILFLNPPRPSLDSLARNESLIVSGAILVLAAVGFLVQFSTDHRTLRLNEPTPAP